MTAGLTQNSLQLVATKHANISKQNFSGFYQVTSEIKGRKEQQDVRHVLTSLWNLTVKVIYVTLSGIVMF